MAGSARVETKAHFSDLLLIKSVRIGFVLPSDNNRVLTKPEQKIEVSFHLHRVEPPRPPYTAQAPRPTPAGLSLTPPTSQGNPEKIFWRRSKIFAFFIPGHDLKIVVAPPADIFDLKLQENLWDWNKI